MASAIRSLYEPVGLTPSIFSQISAELDGILQGHSYLDPGGPLGEAWRAGDSTWSLASDAKLASAQQRVEQMNLEGTMQAHLDEREKKRLEIGQSTFVCGRKQAGHHFTTAPGNLPQRVASE